MSQLCVQALDSNYEPVWGSDQQNLLYDLDAVRQIIMTRLNLWAGEWWENQSLGLPMWQSIMDQRAGQRAQQAMSQLIQAQITSVPFVTGISNVQLSYDSSKRSLRFSCDVQTSLGPIAGVSYPTPPSQTAPDVRLYNQGIYDTGEYGS